MRKNFSILAIAILIFSACNTAGNKREISKEQPFNLHIGQPSRKFEKVTSLPLTGDLNIYRNNKNPSQKDYEKLIKLCKKYGRSHGAEAAYIISNKPQHVHFINFIKKKNK